MRFSEKIYRFYKFKGYGTRLIWVPLLKRHGVDRVLGSNDTAASNSTLVTYSGLKYPYKAWVSRVWPNTTTTLNVSKMVTLTRIQKDG